MTKLRDKSHILLWTLLFFFVASMAVGGLVGGANIMSLIFGGKNIQLNAGRIGGKDITHSQFGSRVQNILRRNNQEINERTIQTARDQAWSDLIDRELMDEKIKSLGLEVSEDEIYEFLLNTPPSDFQAALTSRGFFADEAGQFDIESYQEAMRNRALPVALNTLLSRVYFNLARILADRKLANLYNQLGSVNDEDILKTYMKDSLNCTLDYIYVPISSVADSLIEISDSEISNRFDDDKEDLYTLKKRRTLEYVVFNIPRPITQDDSLNIVFVEDSVRQLADDFYRESDYSSFTEAINLFEITDIDTIDVHETYELNSGIPFQLGVPLRKPVRFAFDNSIGSVSEPYPVRNGLAVFHSLGKKSSGYKSLDDVRESIRRTLVRENKKEYAKNLLSQTLNDGEDWETISTNNPMIQYITKETQKIGGSFSGIGRNNTLTGTLLAMGTGETSGIIETLNAVLILQVQEKDEVDEGHYQESYNAIRKNLLNQEWGNGYGRWLFSARKLISVEDYRSEVY